VITGPRKEDAMKKAKVVKKAKPRIMQGSMVKFIKECVLPIWQRVPLPDDGVEVGLAGFYRVHRGTTAIAVGRKGSRTEVLLEGKIFETPRENIASL